MVMDQVLGGVGIGLVVLSDVVLLTFIFLLYRRVRRLEQRCNRRHRHKPASLELKGVTVEQASSTSFSNGVDRNSSKHPRSSSGSVTHSSTSSASGSTHKDSHKHHTSDNMGVASPEAGVSASTPRGRAKTVESLAKSGKYTQVVAPLPANLRSEEMLMVPAVTEEQLTKCENQVRDPTDLTAEPPSPTAAHCPLPRPSDTRDPGNQPPTGISDYVDPMDCRRPSNPLPCGDTNESSVAWAQVANVSEKKRATSNSETTPPVARSPHHDDYTQVSDALPEGKFERIGSQKTYMIESRTQPSSETSPILSARSAESGNTFQTSPSKKLLKSQSLRRNEALGATKTSPARALKRRSTSDNKEMVCFSPRTGFKLESKSESAANSPEASSANKKALGLEAKTPNSPVLNRKDVSDDVFTTSGQHVYAAVDLTAKCRPREDLIRKEGVGAPDHYVACAN